MSINTENVGPIIFKPVNTKHWGTVWSHEADLFELAFAPSGNEGFALQLITYEEPTGQQGGARSVNGFTSFTDYAAGSSASELEASMKTIMVQDQVSPIRQEYGADKALCRLILAIVDAPWVIPGTAILRAGVEVVASPKRQRTSLTAAESA